MSKCKDARQLATTMKARTLVALVVGDSAKKRERKVEGLLCHRLSAKVLELVVKNFRTRKSELTTKSNPNVAAGAQTPIHVFNSSRPCGG